MTKYKIIGMAHVVGVVDFLYSNPHLQDAYEFLQRFAELVAAEEREACAKVCDARYMGDNNREDMEAKRCAEAIRARS